jgi:hypothetical protein
MEIISEKLRATREALQGVKGKEEMLSVISRYTGKPSERFKYFNYSIGAHTYRGYIYAPYRMQEQGELYGSLFYFWDNAPQVLRAFPKIRYAKASDVMGRHVYAEEKLDGTKP